ncbi:sulfated surface glycoprotein 185-like [Aquila chrysaetos chrysaetos]|uniref:sulfated surface glycoprotein 185-like n=1 Tax=Aquila chrysaetos chrysaetos TaxID=223781 RepID=UPI0011772BE2|nr:sulfated surface glycoprotein 185-like [Aquila chrysaetos chrysaetos]
MLVPKGTPPNTTLGQRSPQPGLQVSPPAPPYIPSAPHHRHHQQPIRGGGATPPPLTRPMGGRGARHAANQEAQVPPSPLPATAPQCEKPPQPHPTPPPPHAPRKREAPSAPPTPPHPVRAPNGVPRHLASLTQNRGVFFKAVDLHSKVLRGCRYLIADPAKGSTHVPALGSCSRCWISRSKLIIMKK